MNPIVIDLPLPSKDEHPNARPHYRVKAAAIKASRQCACLIAKRHKPPKPLKEACYHLIFRLPHKRDYDGLGAWVKSQIDGLVDAGILVDDSDFRPVGIERLIGKKETGGKYGVRFTIWDEGHDSTT